MHSITPPEVDLVKLTLPITPAMRRDYRIRRTVGTAAVRVPGLSRFARLLGAISTKIGNVERVVRVLPRYVALLESDGKVDPASFDSEYGYIDESDELKKAIYLREQLTNDVTGSRDIINKVEDVFDRMFAMGPGIKSVLDFGVSYGHINSVIAKKRPDVQMYGIDRSPLTKMYNEHYFGSVPNLHFVAGDVFDLLKGVKFDALFHMRTATLLPKNFNINLYEKAAAAGVDWVLGAEPLGMSWQTSSPYEFSYNDKPSVSFRNHMFIHNYPSMLKQAGFNLRHAELTKTSHNDPNFGFVVFIAERAG